VLGNIWIDGTATYTNNFFTLKIGGNLHLNGVWDSPRVRFAGEGEQIVSAAPGKVFGASRTSIDFEDLDPTSPLKFTTDLTFIDIALVMNNSTIEFTPGIEVALYEEEIDEAVIIGNNSSLRMGNGSYLQDCDIENLTFMGTVNIGSGNTTSGEIINADTLQNLINGSRTLEVFGNFTNQGLITNTNNNIHFIFHGDVTNSGQWSCYYFNFDGSQDHHIFFAPDTYVYCNFMNNLEPASKIILQSNFEVHNGTIVPDECQIEANGHLFSLRQNASIQACNIIDPQLGGEFKVASGVTFTGNVVVVDSLLKGNFNSHQQITVDGNLINNGWICRGSFSPTYGLQIDLTGNLENNGFFEVEALNFTGSLNQQISSTLKGCEIIADWVNDTDDTSDIVLLTDVIFTNAGIDLSGANLDCQAANIITAGGFLENGYLMANGNYLMQSSDAFLKNMQIENAHLKGVCQVFSDENQFIGTTVVDDTLQKRQLNSHADITVNGNLVNNGRICRGPTNTSYGIRIDLTGNFESNGFFDVERLRFTGTQDQHLSSTQKGTELDIDMIQDTDPGSDVILDTDVTLFDCEMYLNETTLQLNNVNLFMIGGEIQEGYLTSQQNYLHQSQNANIFKMNVSETHLKGDCHIWGDENHFENVTVDDTLRNRDISGGIMLTASGDFINNGIITSYNTYHIELHVEGNFYNHGNALLSEVTFTGSGIQEFSSTPGTIQEADIGNAKPDGHVLAIDDINVSACIMDFGDKELYLQDADMYADGGQINSTKIHGNGNDLTMQNGGFFWDVYLKDITLKNNVGGRGASNTFENVTVEDTLSRGGNFYADIEITVKGILQNNGYIDSDHDSYDFVFFVEDTIVNNGVFMAEKIQFSGSGTHYIQSQGGHVFELEKLFNPANGGPVEVVSDLLLLNAEVDFNGHQLILPENGLLQLDNSILNDMAVTCGENAIISGMNTSIIEYSSIEGAWFFGEFELGEDNIFTNCILDAMLVNDNIYSNVDLDMEGVFYNNNSILNRPSWSHKLYLNVVGHLMHDGVIECEEARWRGTDDQDIYLLNGNEINTPCEFDAMTISGPFQWYKNNVLIDGADDRQYNMPMIGVADRGYFHCETGEGLSRTIRICTPVEIDLDAEAWFCQDETVTLEPVIAFGEPPYTWSWSPATGLSDPNVQNPEANPEEPTLYTLHVTDAIGCTGQMDIMVQQYPQVFASAGNDKEICLGESTVLNGSASGGLADYSYQWTPAIGLNNPNIANPVASPLISTSYTLTVTDQNGCSETDQVTVTVNPLPEVFGLSQDSTHFCYEQDTIIVWLLDSEIGVDYHLLVNGMPNPGGEIFAGTGEAIPVWATTTVQGHYTLKGVNTVTGCENMMEGSVMIFIDFLPEVVDQSGDEEILEGESALLWVEVTSTQPPWLQWYKDGELLDGETNHQLIIDDATLDDTGEYWCVVANNCDVTQSEPVTILVLQQQLVDIPAGWSGFSTYMDLHNPELPAMFEGLGDDLVIVNDFENMYWPAGGVNTYLNWEAQRGAQIKLEAAATIDLRGMHTMDQTLILGPGWHYLPVLSNCQLNTQDLLSPLGDAVEMVKDIAGTGVYWPEFDIYTLATLEPGKAYFLKLNEESEITYPGCTKQSGIAPAPLKPENTSPWPDPAYTPGSHIIAAPAKTVQHVLQPGDWVGIFTQGGVCAGLARFEGDQMAISVFGTDFTASNLSGFAEGEQMRFKVFRQTTGEILDFIPEFKAGTDGGDFKVNGISVVEDIRISGSGSEAFSVYPNPATDYLIVSGIAHGSAWKLCNATGVVVASGALSVNFKIGLSGIQPGVYTLQIAGNSKWNYQKVIVK
jgi:hypothetical protein